MTPIPKSQNGGYLAYLTDDGMLYLQDIWQMGRIFSRVVDSTLTNTHPDYRLYGFGYQDRYLIYLNHEQIHILNVPDLSAAPFSPIPTVENVMIHPSPDHQSFLVQTSQDITFFNQGQHHQVIWDENTYSYELNLSSPHLV